MASQSEAFGSIEVPNLEQQLVRLKQRSQMCTTYFDGCISTSTSQDMLVEAQAHDGISVPFERSDTFTGSPAPDLQSRVHTTSDKFDGVELHATDASGMAA